MNRVVFRSGEFLAIKCKTPDAFLVVQALSDSPDFRTQSQPLDKLMFTFRWYKRSFSYENGSDMYTAGHNDSNLYKFVICTVDVKRVSNTTCLIEAPERFRVLRELREQLSSNDVSAGGGFGGLEAAVKGEDEHTIFGMVPLGVVARTVLNDATFYLVMWKGLPDRYTWESKKVIDENCSGQLSFNDSSSRIITFNVSQPPSKVGPPAGPPMPPMGQPQQRYPPLASQQQQQPLQQQPLQPQQQGPLQPPRPILPPPPPPPPGSVSPVPPSMRPPQGLQPPPQHHSMQQQQQQPPMANLRLTPPELKKPKQES